MSLITDQKTYNFDTIIIEDIFLEVPFISTGHLQLLFMQPKIDLTNTTPFKWERLTSTNVQLNNIDNIMNLAGSITKSGLVRDTEFVLIPEYGIPGIDGVNLLFEKLTQSTVTNQIVIGGIDGLTKTEFISLLGSSSFKKQFKVSAINWISNFIESTWVNSLIIIEKSTKGIKFYLQPKLLPSPIGEDDTSMLEGKWILQFQTNSSTPLKFIVSVCFDWIGITEGLDKLDEIALKIKKELINPQEQWIAFVPQHNPKPSHRTFLEQTRKFLWDEPWKSVHARNAIVIMINSATRNNKDYGESSIIFRNWPSSRVQRGNGNFDLRKTYTMLSRLDLGNCHEARFRNKKPSIHAVELVLPLSTSDTAGEDHYPLKKTVLHTIDGSTILNDPRYPNPPNAVCAYLNIISDYLDEIKDNNFFDDCFEVSELDFIEKESFVNTLCDEEIIIKSLSKGEIIYLFSHLCRWSEYSKDCDTWRDDFERRAINFLISIRAAISYSEIKITAPKKLHGSILLNGSRYSLHVMDLGGRGDYRDINSHIDLSKLEEFSNNILVLITNHSPLPLKSGRFTAVSSNRNNITDPTPKIHKISDIFEQFSNVTSKSELRERFINLFGGESDDFR